MKGFGTVVTGTLISGTIRRDEELEVFPVGRRVRVRGAQVHARTAEAAVAGQRTALNLVGASTEDLSRGMTLAPPATFAATRGVDARLRLLSSAPRSLKNRTRVHFHSGTMETVAEIELYRVTHVDPGSQAFARLKFPASVLLLPGDRFIIRQFSPLVTIGGGAVLDAAPILSPREIRKVERVGGDSAAEFSKMLDIFESRQYAQILSARVKRRGKRGLTVAEAVAETALRPDEIAALAKGLIQDRLIVRFQDRMFSVPEFGLARQNLLDAVSAFHKNDPLNPGKPKGEMQAEMTRLFAMAPELFEAVLADLVKEKKLEVAGDVVRLHGHGIIMKDEEAESKNKIEVAFASAGLKVPALHEVIAGLKVDKARAQKIVTLLLREKVLVKISEELVFHRSALEELRRVVATQKAISPKMDVAKFKELTGVSRKYAIPLLEHLDRERVTRRVGDAREIL
jgi:selenocysteine-specific elongation factor